MSKQSGRRVGGMVMACGTAATLLAITPQANAQTWNGASATTNNFTDGANWVGGVAPVNNGTANLIFGGLTRLAPVVNVAYDVNSITFNNTAGLFSIGGGFSLSVRGGGITNNDFSAQTFTCPIVVNALQNWSPASGGLNFSGSITLNAPLTLNVPTNSVTLTNATIVGTGSLTKAGNSSATIGNSSYSGPTLVTGGTLFSGGANFLSDSSHVQLTGTGNLSLQNNNDTIPSLSSNTGTICSIGTATLTLAANDGGTYTHGGIISGTGNVTKNGDHTAVFASGNTYTGTTTVNAGVLRMSGNERLDDASDLTITGGAVELFGATETIDTLTMTGGELGTFTNPSGTLIANAFNLQGGTVRHTLGGFGNLTKTNSSLNVLISTGGHTYGGSTTISGGTLTSNATDVIPDTSAVTVNSPGIWTISNFPDTIAVLSGNGTVNILSTTLTVGSGNLSGTFSGVIAGTGGNLTKIGTGSLFLNNSNTYTGDTTLNAGILYLTLAERLSDNSEIVVNAGSFNIIDETVFAVSLNGGSLGLTNPGPGQLRAQVISLNAGSVNVPLAVGNAFKNTTGTVILNTPNFFSNLYLGDGVLEVAADNSLGAPGSPVIGNGGTLRVVAPMTFTRTFFSGGNPAIDCQADVVLRDYRLSTPNTTHGLTKTGPGMLTLNCNSVTTGSLSVNAGTVLIDAASVLPAVGISTGTGATLQIDGGLVRTTGLSINNGTLSLSGNARFTGGSLNNSGIIEGSGQISAALFNQVAGDIRVAANESLLFTSLTTSTNAGLIDVIGGSVEFAATLTNSASTGLIFARNAILRFANLTNFGGMAISFGTTDIFGDIDNRAGATITVSGASNATFVGDVINNGTLRTSNGGNTVFLGSVSGSGTFPGTGTVYLEGDLRPGNSPGLMTFGGDVVLGSFATLIQEIGGNTPAQYDRQQIAGDLELDGVLNVQLINSFTPGALEVYPIVTASQIVGRFASVSLPNTTPALHLKYTPTAVILTTCLADFNNDQSVDFFDYLDFVAAFSSSDLSADFNLDEAIDFFDYLDFVAAFSAGC